MSGFAALAPTIAASLAAITVLVAELFTRSKGWTSLGRLTLAAVALIAWVAADGGREVEVFASSMALDGMAVYFSLLLCALCGLAVMMSIDFLPTCGVHAREYFALLLFALTGLLVMAAATDLVVLFIGLETMSISVYVLAGMAGRDPRSGEAAIKYFLMGAFASALLIYGVALVYGATGSTALGAISEAVGQGGGLGSGDGVLMLGVALILVGLGFKVAAVPFHFWAPDVYTGAPTSVTAFMATAVKAGAFAMALRTIAVALEPLGEELGNLMWLAAAATMTVGNLAALRQTGLKRMLAYSSVAHSGYLLIGFCAAGHGGIAAVLFYLAVYGAMNLAAFGVLMAVGDEGDGGDDISRLAGMGHRRPMMAAAMTVAMLSLTGFPPLGGFMGKLFLFSAALEAGLVGLVLVAVANTVLSAVYYLAVVRTMYFVEPAQATAAVRHQPYLAVAVAISVAVVLALGLAPAALMDGAREALALTVLGP